MAKRSVALVDFDDSLFFTRHLVEYATKEMLGKALALERVRKMDRLLKHKIYDLAQTKYGKHSRPNRLLIENLKAAKNLEIVVMTARAATNRKVTLALIKKHNVPFNRLLMRNKKEIKMNDEEWKLRMIRNFLKRYDKINYYEDKLDNVLFVRHHIGEMKRLTTFLMSPNKIKKIP